MDEKWINKLKYDISVLEKEKSELIEKRMNIELQIIAFKEEIDKIEIEEGN